MFASLKKFLFEDLKNDEAAAEFGKSDPKLAAAALMFHVIAADGIVTIDEREKMQSVLQTRYDLSPEETNKLIEHAKLADMEAIDLYAFTSVLRQKLDYDGRLAIIADLWQMVFADGVLNELEDNIVWRVADLLDIDGRDRVMLKKQVKTSIDDGKT